MHSTKIIMRQKPNYAFIDSQNLNLGIKALGWKLDFKRFRVYLKDKCNVEKAFLFIGYVPEYQNLYTKLQEDGYICVFKPTLKLKNNKVKGNVDAELVLSSMVEFSNYQKAVIVSGDGDFHCLIEYLIKTNKLQRLFIPNHTKFSSLLRKFSKQAIFMDTLKEKIEYRKER